MMYGFDFDGTLVKSWSSAPLPNVRERLAELPTDAKTFIATNQAGPIYRVGTGQAKYPTAEMLAANIGLALHQLKWYPDLLLVAVAPPPEDVSRFLRAIVVQTAYQVEHLLRAELRETKTHVSCFHRPSYRKPEPGMLHEARHVLGASDPLVFIDDSPHDAGAAQAAGARFIHAEMWRTEGFIY